MTPSSTRRVKSLERLRTRYSLATALEMSRKGRRTSVRTQEEKHELSLLYEAKIKNMGNAGRNEGEYYTPRPLIRAMIDADESRTLKPSMTVQRALQASCVETYDYLRQREGLSSTDLDTPGEYLLSKEEVSSLCYCHYEYDSPWQ